MLIQILQEAVQLEHLKQNKTMFRFFLFTTAKACLELALSKVAPAWIVTGVGLSVI